MLCAGYPWCGRGAVLVCGGNCDVGGAAVCRCGYPWGVEAAREVLWVPAKQEDGYSRAELPVRGGCCERGNS